jgi:hypothetical protein
MGVPVFFHINLLFFVVKLSDKRLYFTKSVILRSGGTDAAVPE